MSDIKDFKDLKIWEKGMIIAEKCYSITKQFPKEETYLPSGEATGNRQQATVKIFGEIFGFVGGSFPLLLIHNRSYQIPSIYSNK